MRTTELTVLFTPLIFSILFLRISLNSSMSEAETKVTISNSPVTSYSSSRLLSLDRAATTLSTSGDSTKISTKARRRDKLIHLVRFQPPFEWTYMRCQETGQQ